MIKRIEIKQDNTVTLSSKEFDDPEMMLDMLYNRSAELLRARSILLQFITLAASGSQFDPIAVIKMFSPNTNITVQVHNRRSKSYTVGILTITINT